MPYDNDPKLSSENGSDDQKDKYSFLQETIKPKPISREKLLKQFVRIAIYGMIFGTFSCLGFFALKPWAQSAFPDNPETVTIPEDDEPEDDGEGETVEEQKAPVLNKENYEELSDALYASLREAKKGVVFISKVSGEDDRNSQATGIGVSVTGLIAADNGRELLILASDSICGDEKEWNVKFEDNSVYTASLKKRDRNRGLAMFSVPRNSVSGSTWNSIRTATLGNSNLIVQGDSVMAFGTMFGYAGGAGYGIISSTNYRETFYDSECRVLATDISVLSGGTGILFNLDGEVIGMITSEIWDRKAGETANAYSISDLKTLIERMANGESLPYIGVSGTKVTEKLQKEQEMPEGVYVVNVDPDSPAMAAGIQSGDIICMAAGEPVTSVATYQRAVRDMTPGEDVKIKGKRSGADGYVNVTYTVTVGTCD